MHRERSVAVVLPARNEAQTIGAVVQDFLRQASVDRVIVVDNGSRDGTGGLARAAGAEVLEEPAPGYGRALRAGIAHALGSGAELVVLAEADGTFEPSEIERLLARLGACELALGSRTDAMTGYLRSGNRWVARLVSALWPRSSCRLTDVGCTYRAFTARAWNSLRDGATAAGPEFSVQMICEAFRLRLATSEIPVQYGPRKGGLSKHTSSAWAALRTALRMLRAIVRCRLRSPATAARAAEH